MKLSDTAKIFKALSNEQRLKIFLMIYKSCCAGKKKDGTLDGAFTKACGCTDLCRSTISHHLKELQSAGLITFTRKGQTFCCKVNMDVVECIRDYFD